MSNYKQKEKRGLAHLVLVGATNAIGHEIVKSFCEWQKKKVAAHRITLIGRDDTVMRRLCQNHASPLCTTRSLYVDINSKNDIDDIVSFVYKAATIKTSDKSRVQTEDSSAFEHDASDASDASDALDALFSVYLPGPFLMKGIVETEYEEWDMLVRQNLVLPMYFVKCILQQMNAASAAHFQKKGMVLLCGATASDGIRGYKNTPVYSAIKTALMSAVRSYGLAVAEGHKGFSVCGIMPGYIDSGKGGKWFAKKEAIFSAHDFAQLCVSLMKQKNGILNGAILRADGGFFT